MFLARSELNVEKKKWDRYLRYACLYFRNKNSKKDENILVKFIMLRSSLAEV